MTDRPPTNWPTNNQTEKLHFQWINELTNYGWFSGWCWNDSNLLCAWTKTVPARKSGQGRGKKVLYGQKLFFCFFLSLNNGLLAKQTHIRQDLIYFKCWFILLANLYCFKSMVESFFGAGTLLGGAVGGERKREKERGREKERERENQISMC